MHACLEAPLGLQQADDLGCWLDHRRSAKHQMLGDWQCDAQCDENGQLGGAPAVLAPLFLQREPPVGGRPEA